MTDVGDYSLESVQGFHGLLSCSPIWTQPLCKAVSRVDDLNRLRPYIRPCVNRALAIAPGHDGFPRVFIFLTVEAGSKDPGEQQVWKTPVRPVRHQHWLDDLAIIGRYSVVGITQIVSILKEAFAPDSVKGLLAALAG